MIWYIFRLFHFYVHGIFFLDHRKNLYKDCCPHITEYKHTTLNELYLVLRVVISFLLKNTSILDKLSSKYKTRSAFSV